MARILHLTRQAPDPAVIREAADAIRNGKLVAFPTETVYGVGVRFDSAEGVQRLVALKQRDTAKPFTLHLHDEAQLADLPGNPVLPPPARRLADRYWPGPVTLVIPLARDSTETLGVRVVGDTLTRELLRMAGVPLLASSANRADAPPAITGADVRTQLADDVDVIVDAGPAQLQESSTVVATGLLAYRILRQGVVAAAAIDRTATESVCFVCTGNICRSPTAAALMLKLVDVSGDWSPGPPFTPAVRVYSAGVRALVGEPITTEASRALDDFHAQPYGEELRARMLTADLLDRCDRVFVMANEHLRLVADTGAPRGGRQAVQLLDPDGKDVTDPYGESLTFYRRTAARIQKLLLRRFDTFPGA